MFIATPHYSPVYLAICLLAATAAQPRGKCCPGDGCPEEASLWAPDACRTCFKPFVRCGTCTRCSTSTGRRCGCRKAKKKWKQGRQGRVKLARAMENKLSKNRQNMETIGSYPFGAFTGMVTEKDSPLHALRQGQKWEVARMAMFLFQMVMNLTSSYTPNPNLEYKFGSGLHTAPRLALLMHHEESIEGAWKKQLCRKRSFFARALKEGESLKVITGGVVTSDPDNEWRVLKLEDTREKCKHLIQDNATHYTEQGLVSKIDNTKAYENMMSHQSWEAGSIYAVLVGCIY
jgi:hypothetical protein